MGQSLAVFQSQSVKPPKKCQVCQITNLTLIWSDAFYFCLQASGFLQEPVCLCTKMMSNKLWKVPKALQFSWRQPNLHKVCRFVILPHKTEYIFDKPTQRFTKITTENEIVSSYCSTLSALKLIKQSSGVDFIWRWTLKGTHLWDISPYTASYFWSFPVNNACIIVTLKKISNMFYYICWVAVLFNTANWDVC